jgi:hypothetical protein
MTSNYGSLRRQGVQQLPVTVIDNMEQIKFVGQWSHHMWIVPEAIDNPIGVEAYSILLRVTRNSELHGRTNAGSLDRAGMIFVQMVQQRFGHQIHAWPILFYEIAYNCDLQPPH